MWTWYSFGKHTGILKHATEKAINFTHTMKINNHGEVSSDWVMVLKQRSSKRENSCTYMYDKQNYRFFCLQVIVSLLCWHNLASLLVHWTPTRAWLLLIQKNQNGGRPGRILNNGRKSAVVYVLLFLHVTDEAT